METTQKKAASFKGIRSAGWVIVICFIIAVLIFNFVLGNPSNFMNNDPNNHPLPGNFLGTIYKGGFIVPVIQTLLLTVIALSIERYKVNPILLIVICGIIGYVTFGYILTTL